MKIYSQIHIYYSIFRRIKSILGIAVLLFVLVGTGGCKSGKKNVKSDFAQREDVVRVENKSAKLNSKQKALIEEAMSWVGVPYSYGKSDKIEGTDCSGMVLRVYLDVLDIKLPRSSAQQAEFCKEISRKEVIPGDLCFFATGKDPDKISHVGIMIDEANFVHASTKKGVVVSNIDTPYYIRTFKKFGRVK